ncbi:acyltransferase family protein [Pseudoduganella umbonata]|uniref:Acyltransferase n=1 Tax=Pseudoduganella umbonata TaxID=864828 RepID=A0A4P8HY12_9BURK|nr:acyltransferase [Pseudoduganella umbonata]MBB3223214.1 peptidoglycan/LPS O-acetylase OafA/YrhL [Pseudoduganella umbonata]QCP13862.1 acyltransferase [Pseudoduganella umbonata]
MQPTRYAYLDGLRGLAAILVMLRHSESLLGMATYRSYLAVDLFFLLSGFVIAHAYDERLRNGTLGFAEFARIRLIRLYPIYLLSAVLALGVVIIGQVGGGKLNGDTAIQLSMAAAATAFFLPFPVSWTSYLFPLNSVYWSLFFELVVNFLYAAVRPRLTDTGVKCVLIVSGIACAVLALQTDSLDHGYDFSAQGVIGGLARSLFGFSLGVLLYERRAKLAALLRGRFPPWFSFVLVAGVLGSPSVPGFDGIIALACIFFILPLAMVGAAFESPRNERLGSAMAALGAASYPLYTLHGPVIYVVWQVARRMGEQFLVPAGIVMMLGLIVVSIQLERRFDIPVRRWLNASRRNAGAKAAGR